jgi:hypothetical protein
MTVLMKTNSTLLTCPLDGAHSSLMQKINKLLFDSWCIVKNVSMGLGLGGILWVDGLSYGI